MGTLGYVCICISCCHIICNGFTGYNGNCIGFTRNCNGPCWSLNSYWYWSSSIGGLLMPLNPNGICPKHTTGNHFWMVKSWCFVMFVMVFVVETIRIYVMVSIVFFFSRVSIKWWLSQKEVLVLSDFKVFLVQLCPQNIAKYTHSFWLLLF